MPDPLTEFADYAAHLNRGMIVDRPPKKVEPEDTNVSVDEETLVQFITHLMVFNRGGKLVQFNPFPHQERVLDWLLEKRRNQIPARGICCKPRQLGISTLVQAWIFARHTLQKHRDAIVAAQDQDAARVVFRRTRIFYYYLPKHEQLPYTRLSINGLTYSPPQWSQIDIDTQRNTELGRSGTYQDVHVTEVAHWLNPEEPLLGLQNCVPENEWDTLIFLESTAKGRGNYFHSTYEAAKAHTGLQEMDALFIEWKGFPLYSLPGPKPKLNEVERAYVKKWKLTPGEINFYIRTKYGRCHGSQRLFDQEYPMSDVLAFGATQDCFFDVDVLTLMLDEKRTKKLYVRDPIYRGDIQWADKGSKTHVKLKRADETGFLEVWEMPIPGYQYLEICDVSQGVEQDFTVIMIVKVPRRASEPAEQVAKWKSCTINAADSAVVMWQLGLWYNTAEIAVEIPGAGETSLAMLRKGQIDKDLLSDRSGSPFMKRGYPRLFRDTGFLTSIKNRLRDRLGFLVTAPSKRSALDLLHAHIKNMYWTFHSRETINELLGYQRDPQTKKFIQTYKNARTRNPNDDEIACLRMGSYILDLKGHKHFYDDVEVVEA